MLTALALAGFGVTSCSSSNKPVGLAASSLTSVLGANTEIGGALNINMVFAGSPSLVAQLDAGVDAAVIITADETTMERAATTGRLASAPVIVATNRLVLAAAPGNPAKIVGLEDLGRPELLVGTCAPEVPCGAIAQRALANTSIRLAADTEETSVRALATKLSLGELDAGIVYASEAQSLGLSIVAAPELDGFEAVYFAAAISSDHQQDGEELIALLRSAPSQVVLAEAGFGRP